MSQWAEMLHSRSRSRSPKLHNLLVFKGIESPYWEAFIYQFGRIAAHRGWSMQKKAFHLLDGLSDVVWAYARRITQNGDYKDLKRQLNINSAEKKFLSLLVVSCPLLSNTKMRVLKNLPRSSTS
jgi:hypothetical protein